MDPVLIGRAALVAICAAACWFDIRSRIIPNWLTGITFAAGLALAVWQLSPLGAGMNLLHAGIALLVGMALFAIRVIGAGDAKFYAGIAAWFPFAEGMKLLLSVSIAGVVMILAWFLFRRLRGIPVQRNAAEDSGKFPYALAIAGGAMVATFGW